MSILKSKELKHSVKPSDPNAFWWFVGGYMVGKKLSDTDFWALRRYQRMGFKARQGSKY
jgi:hypothetical protein